ncbi:MAG: DNA mismatch repair endonuclease MutL [Lachnospiraceae bacterium]|jgi:DNA mismatch repair protein MutL|nr:DNA mismatch repair endonuclease MutL [Lachnospiraceae bacterium]
MNQITLLSQDTIDKIAAGEVVERPASIVKELVENAVDAGANAVTVEIRDGGISLIRITDNGSGIPKEQVPVAFLRHATSKIRTVDDLLTSGTLGFRGEALSSIAAVCQVEMITKTAGSITGVRYVIEGGAEKSMEEIGAPEGTTFLVRNLFYHTPARKKFLKTAATEAGYVSDLIERMALSHPEISFKFILNGASKLHTSGNCNLKDIVYGIYGREIASNVIKIDTEQKNGIQISGFIGKPVISRGNRNYENYFVNGRYVKSAIVSRAIEDAYKPFMMNHRYPFTVLMVQIDAQQVDVNVHPTKMEVRFASQTDVYDRVYQTVKDALAGKELIPEFTVEAPKQSGAPVADILKSTTEPVETSPKMDLSRSSEAERTKKMTYPEPFEKVRSQLIAEANSPYELKYPRREGTFRPVTGNIGYTAPVHPDKQVIDTNATVQQEHPESQPHQMELFEDRLLDARNRKRHKLIGQIFNTYWLVEFDEKLFIIDQHAAHEKVYYERFMEKYRTRQQTTQMVTPPVIVTLTLQEENVLNQNKSYFEEAGFVIEHFGGRDYAISGVPGNLYGIADRTLFTEILDGLMETGGTTSPESVLEKIASMSCKAAVKGNNRLSVQEADHLIGELLTLENPYNCPHGRPTIISMTKYELEKKFKRIV